MVHHHRSYHVQQHRKEDLEQQQQQQQQNQKHQIEDPNSVEQAHRLGHLMDYAYFLGRHRSRPSSTASLRLLFLFSLISCTLLFAPRVFFYTFGAGADDVELRMRPRDDDQCSAAPCSAVGNNSICCDRTSFRTDVCFMRGDVRTHAASNSIFLLSPSSSSSSSSDSTVDEKIRPYTRKWEGGIMSTIDELRLRTVSAANSTAYRCDVVHRVPAVVFSTGGYTGNVYHEFNDGLIPLYITAQHFGRQVVFVMLEYHDWWMTKHGHVVSRLSDYPPIDFSADRRTHCFPEAIVGLRIHDELSIDAAKMKMNNKSIGDFRRLLDDAYAPRVGAIDREEQSRIDDSKSTSHERAARPKMVLMSRNGSRAIENEGEVVRTAEDVGFEVELMSPRRDTELARIYRALNACDVMVGVHGAAMTHFLFMRPGAVFVQVVPLGTDWAAEEYYGEPARRLGLRYAAYKILPRESSLYREYGRNAAVLTDPDSVNARGWQVTKKVYLEGQNVRLDVGRFRKRLVKAFEYVSKKRRRLQLQQLKQQQQQQQQRLQRRRMERDEKLLRG